MWTGLPRSEIITNPYIDIVIFVQLSEERCILLTTENIRTQSGRESIREPIGGSRLDDIVLIHRAVKGE